MNTSPTANRITPEIIVVSGSDYAWIKPWAESIEGVPMLDNGMAWGKDVTFHVDPDTDYEIKANLNEESFSFDLPAISESMDLSKDGINNNIVIQIYNSPNGELSLVEQSAPSLTGLTSSDSLSALTVASLALSIFLIAILVTTLFFSFFRKGKKSYRQIRLAPVNIKEDSISLSDIKIHQES